MAAASPSSPRPTLLEPDGPQNNPTDRRKSTREERPIGYENRHGQARSPTWDAASEPSGAAGSVAVHGRATGQDSSRDPRAPGGRTARRGGISAPRGGAGCDGRPDRDHRA